jgi:Putative Flp pilus-assembly TadE/G-like
MRRSNRNRRGERGVSFLLVVVGIFSILAMAMFAIDLVVLYAADGEAQKAADAAALAGAKMFVSSSSTSGGTVTTADVCTTGAGTGPMANAAAAAAAQANTIGGVAASLTNVTCTLGTAENPQITVTVGRTNLPLFFARVFGRQTATVSATATAEAYNNSSAANVTKIATGSVKPWLVVDCQPGFAPCTNGPYFFSGGALNTPGNYLGQALNLTPYGTGVTPGGITFYISDLPTTATLCPATGQTSCGTVGSSPYLDNIACANQSAVACGDQLPVSTLNWPANSQLVNTQEGVECLIHAGGTGASNQDVLTPSAGPAPPVVITKGANNPNTPGVATGAVISQSDSVVTVPVFDYTADPCVGGICGGTEKVTGFLQLGIQQVSTTGVISTVVMNAVACNNAGAGTPVTGGGVAPIPVRLVQ